MLHCNRAGPDMRPETAAVDQRGGMRVGAGSPQAGDKILAVGFQRNALGFGVIGEGGLRAGEGDHAAPTGRLLRVAQPWGGRQSGDDLALARDCVRAGQTLRLAILDQAELGAFSDVSGAGRFGGWAGLRQGGGGDQGQRCHGPQQATNSRLPPPRKRVAPLRYCNSGPGAEARGANRLPTSLMMSGILSSSDPLAIGTTNSCESPPEQAVDI